MKRKNGFTLIELLAVIVILAIIALIAVPIILNVIEKSKESSAVDSAYGYIHAIEEGVVESEVNKGLLAENKEYTDLASFESTYGITVKGNKPTSGLFRLEKRQVVYAEFAIDGYSIVCDKKKCESKGKGELITLTYSLDGGTLSKNEDKIVKGSSISLPVPTKDHYGFDGWYLGEERVNNETIFNSNVTLTAHWTKNRYTVTFAPGEGGTASESSLSIDSGETLNLPSASKEGYTFNGWFTESAGGSEVTNETPITSSQTLYAHYTINTYTINFNSNGGSEVNPSSVQVTHGQTLTLPEPEKENNMFNGWYTDAENGEEVTSSTPITRTQTLYAHYISAIMNFDYTETVQEVTLQPGRYKLEVWGAQGGGTNGGYGGYSIGVVSYTESTTIYIYVGGKGNTLPNYNGAMVTGGWNGGAAAATGGCGNTAGSGSGGGATDISTQRYNISFNSTYGYYVKSSYNNRIIVAGGGGGGHFNGNRGGSGGGYQGANGIGIGQCNFSAQGGTQTSGGDGGCYIKNYSGTNYYSGQFGIGGGWYSNITNTGGCHGGSGNGGGGYYGGGAGNCSEGSGGGGSGYIGGVSSLDGVTKQMYMYSQGCTSSNDESTKTTCTSNVSETPTSNYAKQGNGYARITYLGSV